MGILKVKIGYITLTEEAFIHDIVWKYGYDDYRIFPEGTILALYKTRLSHRIVVDFGKVKRHTSPYAIGAYKRYIPLNNVVGTTVINGQGII